MQAVYTPIMMLLLAMFVPCSAQIAVMLSVVPETVLWVVLYLVIGYAAVGYLLSKLIPGGNPEILIDVPTYHIPVLRDIARKMWMRTEHFIKEAVPFVLLGVFIINILYWAGVIDMLANLLEPVFVTWFGVPKETVAPLIAAFLRKDLAVAQLSGIPMTPYQLVTSVVLITIYFPCLATFIVMLKEGWKDMLAALVVLFCVVFLYGGLIHGIGILLGVA